MFARELEKEKRGESLENRYAPGEFEGCEIRGEVSRLVAGYFPDRFEKITRRGHIDTISNHI